MLAELLREYVPPAPYAPPAWELGSPQAWLYVSKRLELVAFPNEPLWCQPAISIDGGVYFRLTPTVLHWLDCAGRSLQAGFEAGSVTRDQVDAFCEAMGTVYAFARANIDAAAREHAKGLPPVLPDAPARIGDESI